MLPPRVRAASATRAESRRPQLAAALPRGVQAPPLSSWAIASVDRGRENIDLAAASRKLGVSVLLQQGARAPRQGGAAARPGGRLHHRCNVADRGGGAVQFGAAEAGSVRSRRRRGRRHHWQAILVHGEMGKFSPTRRTKTSIEQNRTNDNKIFCTAVHTGLLNQSVLKPAV